MNTKFYILILLAMFSLFPGLKAQIPESPTASLTPNAAAMARFGNTPVSLFTGTPEISIPLYTLQSGSLALPISLSYHSGGVKPDEHPGWVGMGWSLQAGGVITREKNDMPDDFNDTSSPSVKEAGFWYTHAITTPRNWADEDFWKAMRLPLATAFEIKDTEPDKYHFNMNGLSGFFVLDYLGNWQVCCDQKVEVSMNGFTSVPTLGGKPFPYSQPRVFSGFTLTTEDGVKYVFGTNGAIEYSIDFAGQSTGEWEATAWYLTEIEHPNGESIHLTYERGDFISHLSSSTRTIMYNLSGGYTCVLGTIHVEFSGGESEGLSYFGELLSPIYLESIVGDGISVHFQSEISDELTYSREAYLDIYRKAMGNFYYLVKDGRYDLDIAIKELAWRRLNSIQITNPESQTLKKVDMEYINTPGQRLTLGNISLSGQIHLPEEKYEFKYRNLDLLPGYLSNEVDHWGFYNNRPSGGADSEYLDKEANPVVLTYGSLQEIIYPTGGKTIFEFEPHTYNQQLKTVRWSGCEPTPLSIAGGIRIKKITDVPGNGQVPMSKEYFYVNDYSLSVTDTTRSSGILGGRALYAVVKGGKSRTWNKHLEVHFGLSSSTSLLPCTNSMGYHVGYSEVTERNFDGSYTTRRYSNLDQEEFRDEQCIFSIDNDPAFFSSRANDRGKLLEQSIYNSSGELLKKIENTYKKSIGKNYVEVIHCQSQMYGTTGGSGGAGYESLKDHVLVIGNGCVYKIFTHSLLKSSETTVEYGEQSATPVVTEILYNYNIRNQIVSKTTHIKRKKETYTNSVSYHYAWESDNDFRTKNFFSLLKHIYEYKEGEEQKHTENKYVWMNSDHTASDLPILSEVYETQNGHSAELRYRCNSFDEKGYPVWVTRDKTMQTVYLWSFYHQYPLAEIQNATSGQVKSAFGISPEKAYMFQGEVERRMGLLRKKLHDSQVISYKGIPHVGIASVTDAAGAATTYSYDTYGRLKEVKDAGGNVVNEYRYQMEYARNGFTPEQYEQKRMAEIAAWAKQLTVKGGSVVQPGDTCVCWVDAERFPCEYRWRIEGATNGVSYTANDNEIIIRNNLPDNSDRQVITLYIDLLEKGKVVASTERYDIELKKALFSMEIYPEFIYEDYASLNVRVGRYDHGRIFRMTLNIDGELVAENGNEGPDQGGFMFFRVVLNGKPKGYYSFEAIDNNGNSVSAEIPMSIFWNSYE